MTDKIIYSKYRDPLAEAQEVFTYFVKLPVQVRLVIWALACSHPRAVVIKQATLSRKNGAQIFDQYGYPVYHFESPTPDPAVLHACHESRAVGLQHYWKRYGNNFPGDIDHERPDHIYVNRDGNVDTICIVGDFSPRALDELWAQCSENDVRVVAMSETDKPMWVYLDHMCADIWHNRENKEASKVKSIAFCQGNIEEGVGLQDIEDGIEVLGFCENLGISTNQAREIDFEKWLLEEDLDECDEEAVEKNDKMLAEYAELGYPDVKAMRIVRE